MFIAKCLLAIVFQAMLAKNEISIVSNESFIDWVILSSCFILYGMFYNSED